MLKQQLLTSIIHASPSSGSCNPSALVHRRFPLSRGVSIEEVGIQATDVKVHIVLTEVFNGHPVEMRYNE